MYRRLRQMEKCLGWLSLRRDWLRLKRWLFGQGTQNQMKLHIVIWCEICYLLFIIYNCFRPIVSLAWLLVTQAFVYHLTRCLFRLLIFFLSELPGIMKYFSSAVLPNVAKLSLVVFLYSTWVYRSVGTEQSLPLTCYSFVSKHWRVSVKCQSWTVSINCWR